jgi:hypothetical protein
MTPTPLPGALLPPTTTSTKTLKPRFASMHFHDFLCIVLYIIYLLWLARLPQTSYVLWTKLPRHWTIAWAFVQPACPTCRLLKRFGFWASKTWELVLAGVNGVRSNRVWFPPRRFLKGCLDTDPGFCNSPRSNILLSWTASAPVHPSKANFYRILTTLTPTDSAAWICTPTGDYKNPPFWSFSCAL